MSVVRENNNYLTIVSNTDYGHPERAFFQKFEIFGLGQTNWAENLWGIWAISGQTISTILALWVPYPWESVAGPLSYKKLWFLGLKHITPKYSQNKIWAVQNLENSVRTSVFGEYVHESCMPFFKRTSTLGFESLFQLCNIKKFIAFTAFKYNVRSDKTFMTSAL